MKSATQVVVDCAGVGYDVQISLHTYADVEPLSEGLLYTYHLVREDAQMLFGFSTQREKALFELLISVSGRWCQYRTCHFEFIEPYRSRASHYE